MEKLAAVLSLSRKQPYWKQEVPHSYRKQALLQGIELYNAARYY
jgi:hypothetical protein